MGAIAAHNAGIIEFCSFEAGSIKAHLDNMSSEPMQILLGGICGHNGGYIFCCRVYAIKLNAENMNESDLSWSLAGGIAGLNYSYASIKHCYSAPGGNTPQTSVIESSVVSTGSGNISMSGGIAGMSSSAWIVNCWSSAKIVSDPLSGAGGGIAAFLSTPNIIQKCVALNDEISGKVLGRIVGANISGEVSTITEVFGNKNMILSPGSNTSGGINSPLVSIADRKKYYW
ncbi:hypothetical protein [Leadbettera azotonutricia]|uniref:GLUG domain-containing protein n=1 Tax=Leadbettera azotonutricia (strain ATCC BAA-888 / DSM 13862 / ZAS-9) TaxID=545695 RepID=F5YA89_LEAAZ|nr:hypothetical protein [Leadbettera azotonutricia]AEF83355.1 hypothetical protein TREAZ_0742 [Leadbettera azotonutricia ZAS-9]